MSARPLLAIIAGGSGSGKSTLAKSLAALHADWTLVHLDDYQKAGAELPRLHGFRNWDHPDAVDFDAVMRDVSALCAGQAVTVLGRSSQTDPSIARVPRTLVPGPLILLEGYLALWHPALRERASCRIFLEAPAQVRHRRRRWNMKPGYLEQVLEPMHHAFVEPTKAHADLVLDAAALSPSEALERARVRLESLLP